MLIVACSVYFIIYGGMGYCLRKLSSSIPLATMTTALIATMSMNSAVTQEQLAERLNVSRQSVSKWESGASFPEMDCPLPYRWLP